MKICPKCHRQYEGGKFCNDCGEILIEQQSSRSTSGGFNLNLGDANAISGGVNMSDNHSVSNNTVSNVDSHNVITNNITQVEREKTPEELKHERELAFRESCIETISNGILTSEGKRKLEDLQYRLGIDETTAARIISEVSKRSERKSSTLSPVHQITYNNIKTAILANRLDIVNRLLMQLKAMVQRYSAEEIQYTYYMLQSILHPEVCISEFESHHEDKYWQSFWSSIAYRRKGNIEKSELLVADVGDKWVDTIPQDNVWILASVNAMIDNDIELAKAHYDNITGEHSPLLSNLATSLYTLLYSDMLEAEDLKQMQKDSQFYTNNLFAGIKEQENERARQQEEMRLQKEAEAKRKAAEEEKQRQEAEKRRLAEEKRLAEEARMKEENAKKAAQQVKQVPSVTESKKKQDDILSNPSLLFGLKDKTASDQMSVYKSLLEQASKGNGKAGSYLAYFYIRGVFVDQDLKEAEKRIMGGNYQSDPVLMQLLVELYTAKKVPALAEIWKRKLSNIKK